uniref:Uncharacterized protein n=1 Tax=Cacopsylla melanoneura TaxID=428564 RepID=A0A8D8VNH5_9HEMI
MLMVLSHRDKSWNSWQQCPTAGLAQGLTKETWNGWSSCFVKRLETRKRSVVTTSRKSSSLKTRSSPSVCFKFSTRTTRAPSPCRSSSMLCTSLRDRALTIRSSSCSECTIWMATVSSSTKSCSMSCAPVWKKTECSFRKIKSII